MTGTFFFGLFADAGISKSFAYTERPLITVSGRGLTTEYGSSDTATITATGGLQGYTFSYSNPVDGLVFSQVDSVTIQVKVSETTTPGTYIEAITATDQAGFTSEPINFTYEVKKANRTLSLSNTKTRIEKDETATALALVSSTIPSSYQGSIGSDGTIAFTSGSSTGCRVDTNTGVITAISDSGNCLISAKITGGTFFEDVESSASINIGPVSLYHNIFFNHNDGTGEYTAFIGQNGDTTQLPADLTRSGYSFLGWSQTSKKTNSPIYHAPVTIVVGDSDQIFYALWAQPGSVTYQLNEATSGSAPTESNHLIGDTFAIKSNSGILNTGKYFKGWSDGKNLYQPGDSYTVNTLPVVFSAIWVSNIYTVTYDSNSATSGSVPTSPQNYFYGDTVTALSNSNNLVKVGYQFLGWTSTADNMFVPVGSDTYTVTQNTTFQATWDPIYNITYDTNGATSGSPSKISDTIHRGNLYSNLATIGTLVRTHYTFNGWSTTRDNIASKVNNSFTPTQDVTLFAIWTLDTFTISASAGSGGSITPSGSLSYNGGDNETFTITADANKHISNVLVDGTSVGNVSQYVFNNISASHTISATFVTDTYTITFDAQGGSNSVSVALDFGSEAFSSAPTTTRTGYKFLGWSFDKSNIVTTYTVAADATLFALWLIDTFTVSASAGTNGTISSTLNGVIPFGGSDTYTITGNSGYHVFDVIVDGVSVGALSTYVFSNVRETHTISATFKSDAPIITASAGRNGKITPSGSVAVTSGQNKTFTFSANPGYHIDTLTVDGVVVDGSSGSYTFTNVIDTHTINIVFAINTWNITATTGVGGSISPGGVVKVGAGLNAMFTVTPDPGYYIDFTNFTVDGWGDDLIPSGANGVYYFYNVQTNHTIDAQFLPYQYEINTSAGSNGSVSPNGATSFTYGENETITITPNTGYHVLNVTVDGSSVGAVTQYVFNNITTGHVLVATFAIDTFTLTSSSSGSGSVSPSGNTFKDYGTSQSYSFIPSANYHVANVLVDGVNVGNPSSYTFSSISASHTILVNFSIDTYTVTFNANGGDTTTSLSFNYGSNALETPTTVTRTGYSFGGWATKQNDSSTLVTSLTVTESKTLYAIWNINSYTVIFNANGGSGGNTVTRQYLSDAIAVAPTVTRTGYTFAGWSLDSSTIVTTYPVTSNITIYAQWVPDIAITSGSDIKTTFGRAASSTAFSSSGGLGSRTFSISPDLSSFGITIDTQSGIVSVTSSTPNNTYIETITVTDSAGKSSSRQMTILVNAQLSISGGNSSLTTTSGRADSTTAYLYSGGTDTKTFSISPTVSGITIGANGVVSVSTDATVGTHYETVTVTDSLGVTASSAITIVVNAALIMSGTNQIFATNGRSFTTAYTASGGTGNKTWAISGLNPKISIDTNGILTIASDLTVGIYYETVTVTDEKSVKVIKSVTIQINDSLGITGPTLILNTFSHTLNSDTYTVTGGTGTKVFSISNDSGISINSSNGSITVLGSVSVGDHPETITVTDANGASALISIIIRVNNAITIASGSGITTTFGRSDSSTAFTSSYGTGSVSFSLVSTPSSSELTINSTTGVISASNQLGDGTYSVVVTVTDSLGVSASKTVVVKVNKLPTFGSAPTLATTFGRAKTFAPIIAQFGTDTLTYSISGDQVGNGISINSTTGEIYIDGSKAVRSYLETITATDIFGLSGLLNVTIVVNNLPTISGVNNLITTKGRAAQTTALSASNGTGPYQFSMTTDGSANMAIDSTTGIISVSGSLGAGTYNETITVTDSSGATGTALVQITVNQELTVSGGGDVETTFGRPDTSSAFTKSGGTGSTSFSISPVVDGISIDSDTGIISVSALTVAGTYLESVTVTDSLGVKVYKTAVIKVNNAITFANYSILQTTIGRSRVFTSVIASGGTSGLTYSISGNIPGISINSLSGAITVPNNLATGTYYDTITATDGLSVSKTTSIQLQVNPVMSIPVISTIINTLGHTAVTDSITVTGGTGNPTFSITSDPDNKVSIDSSTGRITIDGTLAANTYNLTITAVDESGYSTTRGVTIQVNSAIYISGGSNITTTLSRADSSTAFTATGGTGSHYFSISTSSNGISIDSQTGVVRVNGAYAGTFHETVTVTDSLGAVDRLPITIIVNNKVTFVSNGSLQTTLGTAREFVPAIISNGTGTITFSISPTTSGITINTSTGNVTADNTLSKGTYNETITATDSLGITSTFAISIIVNDTMTISGASTITTTQGFSYTSVAYSVTGGTGTRTFSITNDTGISINPTTGVITVGVNATQGIHNLTITVTDSATSTSTKSVQIIVNSAVAIGGGQSTLITTYGRADSSTAFTNSGGTGSKSYTITPTVSGISIDSSTGIVSVSASASVGTWRETVTVTDSLGATSTSIITITVNAAISFGSPDTYVTTFGVTRTFSGLVASNGTGTLRYSISPNTPGISIDTNTGVITVLGTLSANTYYETVTATDSLSVSTKIAITILVNPAMTFGTLPTFATTEGTSKSFSALTVNGGTGTKVFGLISDRPEITIDSGTGVITISSALGHGTYTESITVTDSVNATKQILATFTVNNLMAITSGGSDVTTTRGRADSSTAIIVSGGTGSKTYALGLTAAGISIDSTTGVVRVASTTAAGTWYETVTITDSVGSSIVKNLTVIVNPEISVSGGNNIKTTLTRADSTTAFSATGGTGTLTLSMSPLRSNVSFDSTTGIISITGSLAAGTYYETITATDTLNVSGTKMITIVVNPAITVSGPNTISTTFGFARNIDSYTATGGTDTKTFSISNLNSGVSIDPNTGILSIGSNISVGDFYETITATDSLGLTSTKSTHIYINDVVTISGGSDITTTSGVAKTSTAFVGARGTGNRVFALSPPVSGISIDSTTGVVSVATSATAGSYIETVTVTDSVGSTASTTLNININLAITISSGSGVTTTFGRADSSTAFTASGGTGTLVFSISPNVSGITIDSSTGIIYVAANTASGTYSETVTVTDSVSATAKVTTTIVVNAAMVITSKSLSTTVGKSQSTGSFSVSGGTGSKRWSITNYSGGTSVDTATGNVTISAAVAVGIYNETLTVTDSLNVSTSIRITITVNDSITVTGGSNITTTFGVTKNSTAFIANNGTGTKTFSILPGTNGISINQNSGIVTVSATTPAGTYYETITATDSVTATGFTTMTVLVNPGVTVTGGSNITTTYSRADSSTAFIANNGTGTKTFSILPNVSGISIDSSTGIVSVSSSTAAGTYVETVTATDSTGATGFKLIRIVVNAAITISSGADIATTITKSATTIPFTAAGGTSLLTFSMAPIISGITLDTTTNTVTADGTLSAGTYYETITVQDTLGVKSTKLVTIVVNPAIVISAGSDIYTTRGVARNSTAFVASNGTSTKTFSIAVSPSTSGITINSSTGVVTAAASLSPGIYYETITATDIVGATGVAYESITVNDYVVVAGGQSTLTTTNSRADSTTAFTASGGTVAGSGGVGSYTFSISPTVSGITINSSTGVVTVSNGTASGTYNEVVTATDYVGATGTKSITIVVNAKPIIGGGIGVNAGGGTYTETFNNQGLSVAGLTVVVNGSNVTAASGQATGGSANYLCSYNNQYGTSGCSLGINGPASLVITFPSDSQPTSFSFIGSAVNSPQPLNVVYFDGTTQSMTVVQECPPCNGYTNSFTGNGKKIVSLNFPQQSDYWLLDTLIWTSATTALPAITTTVTIPKSTDTITATAGTGAITLSMSPTNLTGITFNPSTAKITADSSTPAGTYYETITATDSLGVSSSAQVTIVVNSAIAISAGSPIATTFGTAKSSTAFVASLGTGTKTWSLPVTSTGITIDSATGIVTSSNTLAVGTYAITIRATDAVGAIAETSTTVTVNDTVTISGGTASMTTTKGLGMQSAPFTAARGTGTLTFSITPYYAGISINSSTGVVTIDSTTVNAGTFNESVTVTDSVGSVTKVALQIIVNPAIVVSGPSTIATTITIPISTSAFTSAYGTGSRILSMSGTINSGITFDSNTGIISISNSVPAGTYYETITSTDTLNQIGTKMITITVNPAITITAGSSITTTYGTPLSSSAFVANYGTGTKLFSISPTIAGITINPTTGIVTVAGYVGDTNTLTTYLETITATDSVTAFGTTTILITVNPKIVITGGSSSLTTTRGLAIYSAPFTANLGTNTLVFSISPNVSGISIGASSGIVAVDSATAAGTYYESVTATDSVTSLTKVPITIIVNPEVVVSGPTSIATTHTIETTTAAFTSANGTGTRTLSMSGSVDAGITFDTVTSKIRIASSVPAGIYYETITSTDSLGAIGTRMITITVNSDVLVTAGSSIETTYGISKNSVAFVGTNGTGTKTYSISPTVSGITINATTGVVNASSTLGFDTTTTTYLETITATDSVGFIAQTTMLVTVNRSIVMSGGSNVTTTRGRADSSTAFVATYGTGTKTFTISPNVSGITVNSSTGVVSVAATTAAGTYIETVTATDSVTATGKIALTIVVNPEIQISGGATLYTTVTIPRSSVPFTQVAGTGTGTKYFSLTPTISGITIDSVTGVVSADGTIAAGTYYESVTSTDSLGVKGYKALTVQINSAIALTNGSAVTTTKGVARSSTAFSTTGGTVTGASGGSRAMIFSISPSVSGISINSATGVITVDSSTADGTYIETVTATDSVTAFGETTTTIVVNKYIVISGGSNITTTYGLARNSDTFTTTEGTGTKTFSILPGTSGISIGSTTGVVTVSATTPAGTYRETITATDSVGSTSTTTMTVLVNPAISVAGGSGITTTQGIVGTSLAFTSDTSTGTGVKTFSLTPTIGGITIDPTTGVVTTSDTLTAGTYTESVTATDTLGVKGYKTMTILINPVVTVTGGSNITTTTGIARSSAAFQGNNGTGTKSYSIAPSVTGISINATTGVVTVDTNTAAGTYIETVTATDTVSATGYKLITILVNVPVQIANGSNITTTFGLAKTSSAFTATGGTSPITFSIAPGTNGISINSSTGVVTVSATTPAGTYIETVTATDSVTATSTTTMTVLVNPAISVAGGSGITTTQGIVGTSLAFTSDTSTGTGVKTFSLTPTIGGITIDPTTGVVTTSDTLTAGTYTESVTATDTLGVKGYKTMTILINPVVTVTGGSNIVTTYGFARSSTAFSSPGTTGTGTKTYSISPTYSGITIDTNTGVVTADSTTAINSSGYLETITVTDSVGAIGTTTMTIIVNPSVTISGGSNVTTTYGRADSSTAFTRSGGSVSWIFSISPTVSGITIDSATGIVYVAANTAPGTYLESVTVTDAITSFATKTLVVQVNPAIVVSGGSDVTTTYGIALTSLAFTSDTSTGTGVKTFTLTPTYSGVTIDANTGVISVSVTAGTSGAKTTYIETVTATDTLGVKGYKTVTIIINPLMVIGGGSNSITLSTTYGIGRKSNAFTVTAGQGTGSKSWAIYPTYTGISIDSITGIVTVDSFTAIGKYKETVTVTDSLGSITELSIGEIVIAETMTITGGSGIVSTAGVVGESSIFGFNFSTGGTGLRTWTLTPVTSGITLTLYDVNGNLVTNQNSTPAQTGKVSTTVGLVAGTYYETVTITDIRGSVGTYPITIVVNDTITVTGGSNIATTYGIPLSSTAFTASRGTGTLTFSLYNQANTALNSNSNISINSTTGVVSVTGTLAVGTYNLTVRATDSVTAIGTKAITIVVNDTITVSGGSDITTTYGIARSSSAFTSARGTTGRIFSITGNKDITGITINPTTGIITVAATTPVDTYTITVIATDSVTATGSTTMTVRVNDPLVILFGSNVTTTYGRADTSTAFSNTGGTGPFTFSILPNVTGIAIGSSSGKVTVAKNTAPGTYVETVTVQDAVGATNSTTMTIQVNESVTVTGGTNIVTTYGIAKQTDPFVGLLGTGSKTLSISSMPSGMTFDSTTGIIYVSGTVAANTYYETVTATDSLGLTGSQTVTIRVNPTIVLSGDTFTVTTYTITTQSSTHPFTGGTVVATGGASNMVYSLDETITGISINATNGVITVLGSLTDGTYYETITATDAVGAIGKYPVTIYVNKAVTITKGSDIVTTYGRADSSTAYQGNLGTTLLSRGSANFVYSIARNGGSQPSGITINSATGIVYVDSRTAAGTYYETVTVKDSMTASASVAMTITVNPAVTISGATNIYTTYGIAQTRSIPAATGGTYTRLDSTTRAYIYSIAGGIAVGHATIDSSTGEVTIDATTPVGTYVETITATDALDVTGTETFTVIVNNVLTETGTVNMVTTFGKARTYNTITTTGGTSTQNLTNGSLVSNSNSKGTQALVFTLDQSADSITINSATGAITIDSSTAAGTYSRTITVTDSVSATASFTISILVNQAPVIGAGSNIITTFGRSDSATGFAATRGTALSAVGSRGTIDYIYSFGAGSESVTGITINSATGVVSVSSSVAARANNPYKETITVTDSMSVTSSVAITILVNPAVSLSGASNIYTTYGIGQIRSIPSATGGTLTRVDNTSRAIIYSIAGGIAGGHATIDSSTGTITIDSTTAAGTYVETITATDALDMTGTETITVKVNSALTETGTVNMVTTFGKARTYNTITVTGGTATDTISAGSKITYNTSGGTIPLVFSLDVSSDSITVDTTTGAITIDSTTPVGTYSRTITVTDSVSATANMTVSILVNRAPQIGAGANIITTYGRTDTATGFAASYGTATNDTNSRGTRAYIYSFGAGSETVTGGITIDSTTGVVTVSSSVAARANNPYKETITVTDSMSATSSVTMTILVNDSITVTGSKNVYTTYGISQTMSSDTATGGTYTRVDGSKRSYIFSLAGGITGGHATIDSSTGVVTIDSTTPVGTYTETITVTDALDMTGMQTFTVKVNSALTETGTAVMVTTFGRARTYNDLTVTGGTATDTFTAGAQKDNTASGGTRALIFSLNSNSDTITINSATGALTIDSSTPAGTYNRTITVTDSVSATASMDITIYVNPAIVVTSKDSIIYTTANKLIKSSTPVVDTTTGTTSYTHGAGSFSFSFATGSDTNTGKITINASTGVVTVDSATSVGTHYETITVTDSMSATTQFPLTVVVNDSVTISAIPNITTTWTISRSISGNAYSVTKGTVSGSGGSSGYVYSISSRTGLSIDSSTGTISIASDYGDSTTGRTYTETVTAMDNLGMTGYKTFTITVNKPITISDTPTVSAPFETQTVLNYAISFGTTPYTAQILGTTPTGVRWDTSTYISTGIVRLTIDTHTVPQTFTETITVTDSVSATASKAVTITVRLGQRTSSLTATPSTIKYGETLTVTTSYNTTNPTGDGGAYQTDGSLTYSIADTGTACSIDTSTGVLSANGGYGTCKVKSVRTAGNSYDSVTSTTLSITISQADTLTATMGALMYETYTGSAQAVSDRTFTVSGLVNSDSATSVSYYYYDSRTTCATGGSCQVGDTGPGGGIVFYVSTTLQPWGRYLEIAPSNWYGNDSLTVGAWCDVSSTLSRMSSSLGDGLLNTNIMKNKCASGAAKLATSYHGGNQSDWFLPSSNDFVYFESSTVAVKNAAALTSTGTYLGYWASDETGTTNATVVLSATGLLSSAVKTNSTNYMVRPIRAFDSSTAYVSYSSSTAPTNAGYYAESVTAITLALRSTANYKAIKVNPTLLQIVKANQSSFTIPDGITGGVNESFTVTATGGSGTGAITYKIVSGGTASGCSISGSTLRATSVGTCLVSATKAADQNYYATTSIPTPIQVTLVQFINYFGVQSVGSGPNIGITAGIGLVYDSGTTPNVTGNDSTVITPGTIKIYGTGMTGVSAVKLRYTGDFALNVLSFTYQDSSTIVVTIGAGDKSGRLFVYNAIGFVPAPNGLTVQPPNISLTKSSDSMTVNTPVSSYAITNSGSAISSYAISGTLPSGVTFSTSDGTISGTPIQTGTFSLTITANGTSGTSSATYTLTVNSP